jgi:UDP-glucuronate 4-epimerase
MRRAFITGSAGFIGFHLAQLLLEEGFTVAGYDGMTEYYEVGLKEERHRILREHPNFTATEAMLEDAGALSDAVAEAAPEVIVHLAAQAGVRYSLENPRAYVDANLVGTFNLREAARVAAPAHLLMASTSSAYGANPEMPFRETDKSDFPLTLYAATKKANEAMAHSYAHLWNLPTTMFRFFTVYGPYGRPDMALFKFVRAALAGEAIDVYNHGRMGRDFTYVGDLVRAIRLLIDVPPVRPGSAEEIAPGDSLSPMAPWRMVNIGNGEMVQLGTFIEAIEDSLGFEIRKTYMEMQKGDVPATWASSDLLHSLTGYRPATDVRDGVKAFVAWYREYYDA